MAGDVPLHVHFDFEGDLPDFSGVRSLGGGAGNPSLASVPNMDACMANAKGEEIMVWLTCKTLGRSQHG